MVTDFITPPEVVETIPQLFDALNCITLLPLAVLPAYLALDVSATLLKFVYFVSVAVKSLTVISVPR